MYEQLGVKNRNINISAANNGTQMKTSRNQSGGFVDNRQIAERQMNLQRLVSASARPQAGVCQRMTVYRFINRSHSNRQNVFLRENARGRNTYAAGMNHGVGANDGMSTYHESALQDAFRQGRPYVAPIQVSDQPEAGGHHTDGPFRVTSGNGYFAYRTPQCGGGNPNHWSVNTNNAWDRVANAGMANVDNLAAAVKNQVMSNPLASTAKTINAPWV